MSQPGWYPDPAGAGRLRYWDGGRWTEQVQGPADPVPPARPSRGGLPGWLLSILALVVVGLVAVAVIRFVDGGGLAPVPPATEDSNSSTPTVSGWNDGVPTPDPSSAAPINCDTGPDQTTVTPGDASVTVGPLTMPSLGADWSPQSEPRMPLGSDGYGYAQRLPEKIGWASSMSIGAVADPDFNSTGDTVRLMAQCILTSGLYTSVDVTSGRLRRPGSHGGRRARNQAVFTVRFDHPDLVTKGSKLRITVIDSSPLRTWFFAAVPMERDDHRQLVDTVTQGLTLR